MQMYELVNNLDGKGDVIQRSPIDFNPSKCKTKEEAAKGLAEALKKWAKARGYDPEEIRVYDPERTMQYTGCRQWCVVWEGGPFEWAIAVSFQMTGPWGFTEPYYSFDLHFTD